MESRNSTSLGVNGVSSLGVVALDEPLTWKDGLEPPAEVKRGWLPWRRGAAVDETQGVAALRDLQQITRIPPTEVPLHTAQEAGLSWGMELELAARDPHLSTAFKTQVPPEAYASVLQAVNRALGPDGGPIKVVYNADQTLSAHMVDRLGRAWSAVPEYLDTARRKNGFELVGPPLTAKDVPLMQRVRTELQRDFVPGIRSSSHNTFDVSHLIGADDDATRVVNFIIGVEKHWPEIYAALGPQRYGTIVNRFAVPLAVNQRDLLDDLAALRTHHPTLADVKAVFDRYQDRERELMLGATDKPYKYRAANYSKLFAEPGKPNLVEFRICDLLPPEELPRMQHFLEAVVSRADRLGGSRRAARFQSPFDQLHRDLVVSKDPAAATRQLLPVNETITQLRTRRYEMFLQRLGLSLEEFPKETGLFDNPLRLSEAELNGVIRAIPYNRPVEVQGGRLFFDFHANVRTELFQPLVEADGRTPRGPVEANSERFPFLESIASSRGQGDVTVHSQPSETLGDVFGQMKTLRRVAGPLVTAFDLTVEVPKEAFEGMDRAEAEAWLGRVSDVGKAWRLENRRSLYTKSAELFRRHTPRMLGGGRAGPATVTFNATPEGDYQIHIGGYRGAVVDLEHAVTKMVAGLKEPEYVRGFAVEQRTLSQLDSRVRLESLMSSLSGAELTAEQHQRLGYMLADSQESGEILPLMGFEAAPYLTPSERRQFSDATREFVENVHLALQDGRLDSPARLRSRFMMLVFRWARDVSLYRVLDSSILLRPGVPVPTTAGMVSRVVQAEHPDTVDWFTQRAERHAQPLIRAVDDQTLRTLEHQFASTRAPSPTVTRLLRNEMERRGLDIEESPTTVLRPR